MLRNFRGTPGVWKTMYALFIASAAASPLPFFVLIAGGFLLLSFVLILVGPRNDGRR